MNARVNVGGGTLPAQPLLPKRVGLLGGSFNPAHSGHLLISQLALDILALDQVWWLVSPQNPMKRGDDMAPFPDRLARATEFVAAEPRILVSDLEQRLGTRYTAHTLAKIKARWGGIRFVWIMGADNLVNIHRWREWTKIFRAMPVAVFDRPTYSFRAKSGVAARRFAVNRVSQTRAAGLADHPAPAWAFLSAATDTASATAIRQEKSGVPSGATNHRA